MDSEEKDSRIPAMVIGGPSAGVEGSLHSDWRAFGRGWKPETRDQKPETKKGKDTEAQRHKVKSREA